MVVLNSELRVGHVKYELRVGALVCGTGIVKDVK